MTVPEAPPGTVATVLGGARLRASVREVPGCVFDCYRRYRRYRRCRRAGDGCVAEAIRRIRSHGSVAKEAVEP